MATLTCPSTLRICKLIAWRRILLIYWWQLIAWLPLTNMFFLFSFRLLQFSVPSTFSSINFHWTKLAWVLLFFIMCDREPSYAVSNQKINCISLDIKTCSDFSPVLLLLWHFFSLVWILKDLPPVCNLLCFANWPDWQNFFWQVGHLYGFSPVWVLSCSVFVELQAKVLWRYWHW